MVILSVYLWMEYVIPYIRVYPLKHAVCAPRMRMDQNIENNTWPEVLTNATYLYMYFACKLYLLLPEF